jgi:outer membrane usher protein
LGAGGLLNFALSGSAMAGRRGAAGLLGYSYQSRRWSLGLSVRKDWGEYISLGDPPVLTNRKYEASANVGYNIDGLGSLSFSHSIFTTQRGANSSTPSASQPFVVSGSDNRRTTSLALAAPLSSGRALFSAGLSHVKDTAGSRNEIFARLMILLGKDYSTTSHVQYDKDSNSQQVQFIKNQPGGEGLGYVLSADRVSDTSQTGTGFRTTAQFNAPAAVLRADYNLRRDQGQGSHNYQLSVAGGLARVGGFTGFARPISGAFALVKVGELPDVTVRLNNQPVGKTDAQGKLFIPTLSSYMDSSISIAPESVPIQYALATMTKKVSPSARSGMLIEFAATKIQAITGKLHMLDGSGSKPLENFLVRYTVEGKTQSLQTGRGGEFYLENVPAGSYPAAVDVNGKPCDFEIAIPKSDEMFVELPTIVCRLRP